jgi:hypothetical protein
MATITTVKRVLKVSKGLVTLSSACVGSPVQSNTTAGIAASLSMGAAVLTYYYCRPWLMATNKTLRAVLEGNCNEELSEELTALVRPIELGGWTDVEPVLAPSEKRRIKKGCRNAYQREVVAAVKAKFGVPSKTEANRRAIRRYATEVMRADNMRHTHLQRVLPIVVEAAFVPDRYEIEGAKVANCALAKSRQFEYGVLKQSAGFAQA